MTLLFPENELPNYYPNLINSDIFPNVLSKDVFSQWVERNDFIKIRFMSREHWEGKNKGKFIEKLGPTESNPEIFYIGLNLPEDLKFYEFIKLCKQLNEGKIINSGKTKKIINFARAGLFKLLSSSKLDDKANWVKENPAFFDETGIVKSGFKKATSKYKNIYSSLESQGTPFDSVENIEKTVIEYLEKNFLRIFMIKGLRNISEYLDVFTFDDALRFHSKKELADTSRRRLSDLILKGELDTESEKLRDRLKIDELKVTLSKLRKGKRYLEIIKTERKFVEKLLKEVYKYPRHTDSHEVDSASPVNVILERFTICVSKVLICAAFLSELNIKYYVLTIPEHIALQVNFSGSMEEEYNPEEELIETLIDSNPKQISFDFATKKKRTRRDIPKVIIDPTFYDKPLSIDKITKAHKYGNYYRLYIDGKILEISQSDSMLGLISSLLINNGHYLLNLGIYKNDSEIIKTSKKFFELSSQIDAENYMSFFNLGYCDYLLGNYNDAINGYKYSLSLYPLNEISIYNISECYYKLGNYQLSLDYLNSYIQLNPEKFDGYYLRSLAKIHLSSSDNSLHENINEEIAKDIDRAIELGCSTANICFDIGSILFKYENKEYLDFFRAAVEYDYSFKNNIENKFGIKL